MPTLRVSWDVLFIIPMFCLLFRCYVIIRCHWLQETSMMQLVTSARDDSRHRKWRDVFRCVHICARSCKYSSSWHMCHSNVNLKSYILLNWKYVIRYHVDIQNAYIFGIGSLKVLIHIIVDADTIIAQELFLFKMFIFVRKVSKSVAHRLVSS